MLGIHWTKDFNPSRGGGGGKKTANMIFHNGEIMPTVSVQAIFWGGGWSSPGDKITGLDTYYAGFGGSRYAHASDEYNGTNGQGSSVVSFTWHIVGRSTASGGGRTS